MICQILKKVIYQFLIDDIVPNNLSESLTALSIAMIVLAIFKIINEFFRKLLLMYMSQNIDISLLLEYYHVIDLPMSFFGTRKVGEIISYFRYLLEKIGDIDNAILFNRRSYRMKNIAIRVNNLTKKYNNKNVIENISFDINKGGIYAMVGPNGAGKTTIFRILSGLANGDNGNIEFFGNKDNIVNERKRISFMIETPYLDESLTAYENLKLCATFQGIKGDIRIKEVLKIVGLDNENKKKVCNFSLGMKQRLGIAIAILKDPEILVLDEPMNGLDPNGIIEIRNLIKNLNANYKKTILISSHLLGELYYIATDYIFIKNGKIVEKISLKQLNNKCRKNLVIKSDDIEKTIKIIKEKLYIKNYYINKHNEIVLQDQIYNLKNISKTITDSGIILLKLNIEEDTLENYYIKSIGGYNE